MAKIYYLLILPLISLGIYLLLTYTLIILTILALIIAFSYYLYYNFTFWDRQGIPNVFWHQIESFQKPQHLADLEAFKKYGPIFGTYEGFNPTLFISDPELAAKIYINQFKDFPSFRNWTAPGHNCHEALMSCPPDKWKMQRQIQNPAFSARKIKNLKNVFEKSTNGVINQLEKHLNGEKFDVKPYIEAWTLDILTMSVFGLKLDSINDPNNPIVKNARNLFSLENVKISQILAFFYPRFFGYFGFEALNKESTEYFAQLSYAIIEQKKKQNIKSDDILQYLLDGSDIKSNDGVQRKGLSPVEIKDNIIQYFIAGYDAVTIGMLHFIYILMKHPDVQEKLINEIKELLPNDDLDLDVIIKMPFLEGCLMETIRLYPPISRTERRGHRDAYVDGVIFIPTGTKLVMSTYGVHQNAFDNEPEKFIPERMMPENRVNIKPGCFIPFGEGPRKCLGYKLALTQIKISIVMLLRKYEFLPPENEMEPLNYKSGQPTAGVYDLFMKIKKRE